MCFKMHYYLLIFLYYYYLNNLSLLCIISSNSMFDNIQLLMTLYYIVRSFRSLYFVSWLISVLSIFYYKSLLSRIKSYMFTQVFYLKIIGRVRKYFTLIKQCTSKLEYEQCENIPGNKICRKCFVLYYAFVYFTHENTQKILCFNHYI